VRRFPTLIPCLCIEYRREAGSLGWLDSSVNDEGMYDIVAGCSGLVNHIAENETPFDWKWLNQVRREYILGLLNIKVPRNLDTIGSSNKVRRDSFRELEFKLTRSLHASKTCV
jgi:hypothetical protein